MAVSMFMVWIFTPVLGQEISKFKMEEAPSPVRFSPPAPCPHHSSCDHQRAARRYTTVRRHHRWEGT